MSQARDTYERYLEDIASHPRITPEREAELSAIIMAAADPQAVEAATDELIHANLRLVVHCLKDFDKFLSSPAVRITRMDLIAEGNIGLMKAAQRFNATFSKDDEKASRGSGIRFSTYACKCIKSRMRRALKLARFIHIPEHHFGYWSEMEALRHEHGETVSDKVLRNELDVSDEVLGLLKQSSQSGICMLEDLAAQETDGGGWHDFIPNEAVPCPADETGRNDLRAFLVDEMKTLPPRTRNMLSLMYFNEHAPTLRELSHKYGISSERCRQVCAQGLQRLRRQMSSRRERIEPDLLAGLEAFAA
ncbi:MAG: sigma-70 family RNA polymerase sigma factor [Verrucomicrobia bacterium]|jgi:RNA polymerase primary sigma factor|nr:sigma-70 family RNA polymerase sigma factor [Verrucomicrobiota bacterium]